ncbi:MAG TPA: carboxypeptidase regulatory-like domain-containing protein [Bacteroidales bacterium]|nr:carboxypeptidase regulatory-like domain-containing protein [Bacteroidales bacterium]HSA43836.1 carboxypeptidase regulatory-like domain-containing protein [Bacteroidales bacterium]
MIKSFPRLLLFLLTIVNGSVSNAQTVTLPHSEHFNTAAMPAGWTQQHGGDVQVNNWSIVNQNQAGGTPYEAKASWVVGTGYSRLVMPPVYNADVQAIFLEFRHWMNDYSFGLTFKIQSSPDGINWTDESWSRQSGNGNLGPELVSTVVSGNLQDTTYIAFTIEGNLYYFLAWHIDNVEISPLIYLPTCSGGESPLNGSQSVMTSVNLQWETSPYASDYYLYLGTDNPPTNILNGVATGGATHFNLQSLTPQTQYYWKVIPFNLFGQPPGCAIWSFSTMPAQPLPFEEHFNALSIPFGWFEQDSAVNPGWYISPYDYAGGSPNELEFDFQSSTGVARFVSPPLQTNGQGILYLSFNHNYWDDFPGLTLKVQSSADAVHWTDEEFFYQSGSGDLGPELVETEIVYNLGLHTYVAFVLEGDLSAFFFWIIDDIVITGGGQAYGSVEGIVTYDNVAQTPLAGVSVYLRDQGQAVIDTLITDAAGHYAFNNLVTGSYSLSFGSMADWGGGNSIDALLIMRHFVGLSLLSGVRLKAADTDGSQFINAVDALVVMRRFVGLLGGFVPGDWQFLSPSFQIIANLTKNIPVKGLCTGDVDASFTPQ